MTQLTVRGIEGKIEGALREKAEKSGKSINQTVIDILRKALGVTREPTLYRDLDHLAGTWDQQEAKVVEERLREQRQVDPDLWK